MLSFKQKLVISILIFEVLRDTSASFLKNINFERNDNAENMLKYFMIDLSEWLSEKSDVHHVTILGKHNNLLEVTECTFRDTPRIVGNRAEIVIPSDRLGTQGVAIIHVNDLTRFELQLIFDKLPNDFAHKVLLVSVNESTTDETIIDTMRTGRAEHVHNVLYAQFKLQAFKIYGQIIGKNCHSKVALIDTWVPEIGFLEKPDVFWRRNATRESTLACPLVVSTLDSPPVMILQRGAGEPAKIVGGIEGRLILAIASHLNLKPIVKLPSAEEQGWVAPNGTSIGIIGDVAGHKALIGIGQLRPTPVRNREVDFTNAYNRECLVWVVPSSYKPNFNIVFSEFSPRTWLMVVVLFLIISGIIITVTKFDRGTYQGPSMNVLDVISMSLGNAIPHQPRALFGKSLFLLYLHYSRIISTAYTSSLASILSTMPLPPAIAAEDDILTAGLRAAGSLSSYEMLRERASAKNNVSKLLDRFLAITSIDQALDRINYRGDIAYIRHISSINYVMVKYRRSRKPVGFHTLKECITKYSSVVAVEKGSAMKHELDEIITRLQEAGIFEHWKNIGNTNEGNIASHPSQIGTLIRLKAIFLLYIFCLIPAILTFPVELLLFKIQQRRKSEK